MEAFGFKNQVELFNHVWETSNKKCFVSGRDLTKVPAYKWHNMFAHVLPKGKYSKWKLNPVNIVVLHPDIHYLYDFGTIEQQNNSGYDFEPLRKLKEQLKIEYEENYKPTVLC